MKKILVKDAARAIALEEDFKAGDLYGLAWKRDSPFHPIARRIDSMPPSEMESLLHSAQIVQSAPIEVSLSAIPSGLYYLVSSYGVPIAWLTCDGEVHRTKLRHSDATAKHIESAIKGLCELSEKLTGRC